MGVKVRRGKGGSGVCSLEEKTFESLGKFKLLSL